VIRSGTGAPAEVFFEDMPVGSVYDLGTVVVDHDEMLAFAERFDPQWYHVNADLAKDSPYGQIIASGFFTAALFMRSYVDQVLTRAAGNASPGLEELRWLAPVYAGDRLSTRMVVLGAEPSQSRPGFGTLKLQATMVRIAPAQNVMRTTFRGWFAKRPT